MASLTQLSARLVRIAPQIARLERTPSVSARLARAPGVLALCACVLGVSVAHVEGAGAQTEPGPVLGETAAEAPVPAETAYAFSFTGVGGAEMPLSAHAGAPMLIVNTASRCGFTPQYDGLQALAAEYAEAGLIVIGVSSDSFNQELATAAEVKDFCDVNFGITFPLTDITPVTGPESHPFYAWVRAELGDESFPAWNFNKVLIGRDGAVLSSFASSVRPEGPKLRRAVEAALAAPVPALAP